MPATLPLKVLAIGAMALIYFATARLGLTLASVNVSTTVVWPPTGIALAALLVFGYHLWPGILLGAFFVNITTSPSIPAALLIAVGNTFEALLGVYLINRFANGVHAFERPLNITKFALLAAFGASAAGATIGATTLLINDLAGLQNYGELWFTWWMGDSTGALIVTPLLIFWWMEWRRPVSRDQLLELVALFVILLLMGLAVFERGSPIGVGNYPAAFLIFPVVVWTAFRFGCREAVTAVVILYGMALWGTLHGYGPFAAYEPNIALLLLNAFMATTIMIALVLGTVVAIRRKAEEQRSWLATIVESSSDAIIGMAKDAKIISWNQAAERMLGYSDTEVIGRHINMLLSPECAAKVPDFLESIARGEDIKHYETEWICKDGKLLSLSLTVSPIRDADGIVRGMSTIARDITERKRAEEKIQYLAQYDALTGLPNRMLFYDRLGKSISQAQRSNQQVALLFLDLDHFKHINDTLGHQIGDRLLRMVARRLLRCVRDGDSVGRLGGDEFVVSIAGMLDANQGIAISSKVLEALREPFRIDQHELHITGSIGIALYPADGQDAQALMGASDSAMYHAKDNGRDNYQFFMPSLNKAAERWLSIANRLHQAMERGEFSLNYQPQVDLSSGKVVGTEALLRWRPPGLDRAAPSEFVKIAEKTGLITSLGEWVLREACLQTARWRQSGAPDMHVAVNFSPQQFYRPGLVATVARILDETGLPPSALEMEITESILVTNSAENYAILEQLVKLGVCLAVDDFGTGYSSLAYLQRFPIHCLKIDQSFVDGIDREPGDTAIVTAIIAMARSLNLDIVAEGVERSDQAEFLKTHGCHRAQGFYYSAAMSVEAMSELLGGRTKLFMGA